MTDDPLRAALDDPRFRRAVDEVFAAPGAEFGPAKGYYGGDTGHFIDMLWAALAASAPDERNDPMLAMREQAVEFASATDEEPTREAVCRALIRYLETEPEIGTFRALIDYLDLDYSTAYAEGWMDFNNLLVRIETARPAAPVVLDVELENRVRRIVERTANMGGCSQTHHEHLASDASKVYAALSEPSDD